MHGTRSSRSETNRTRVRKARHLWFQFCASLVVQRLKRLPAMRETWVRSLSWEDPLEKGKNTPVFLPGEFHELQSQVVVKC